METAAATAVTLPDDVVREILVRVAGADPYALFRCAMTCKRWHVLVADRSFLRRCWAEDAPYSSTLVGFFAPQDKDGAPVFVPAHRSPISSSRRFLGSFCSQAAGFLQNAVSLTSRRGLLLVLIRQQGTYDDLPKQLAVCDVLVGTCVMLPPLYPNVKFTITGHTILTTTDYCLNRRQNRPLSAGYSSFFKVLIIGRNYDGVTYRYHLTMFSSDEPSWTAPRECLINHADVRQGHRRGGAVVCRGIARWLFTCGSDCYTLNVSADTGHVSSTKLLVRSSPFNVLELQLIVAVDDGTLCLLHMRRNGNRIRIWTRQEGESGDDVEEWLCTRVIKLKRPRSKLNWASSICVGERSGTLLFWDPFLYVANLETGTTESVRELFEGLLAGSALPLVLDWPSLFMSRLGDSKEDARGFNLSSAA